MPDAPQTAHAGVAQDARGPGGSVIEQVLNALFAVVVGVGASLLYFFGTNWLLDRLAADRINSRGEYTSREPLRLAIRPWLFLAPALIILGIYLVYPVFETTRLSLYDRTGNNFVAFANYRWALQNPEFLQSVRNNLLWLLFVPSLSTAVGLVVATLADRVRWGNIAKSLIFMPMAISFVGASVIWKFVYDFRGPNAEQIGVLNAIWVALGGEPQAWITIPFWNNFLLMIILVWIQTGFAMVILSAALRGVPEETIEAAQIDGASPFAVFFRVVIPQISSTILVVWTTITIVVLKVFDIVLAMTNGQWGTNVLANSMYNWMFRGGGDFGRGSVIALVIMVAVVPIMVWNIRRFQAEERMR
jgi:alpha-glucoside transport system permease protein